MKAIKDILSGKGLPRRGEKGFTLVELLIVLAILAVLAAVVIPNVTGMFGRGAKQSFSTDSKTIQTSVATFYFDTHTRYANTDTGWGSGGTGDLLPGHYYPTKIATVYPGLTIETTPTEGSDTGFTEDTYLVKSATGDADDGDIIEACIWMGLMVNIPSGLIASADPSTAAVVTDEDGPYLNEFPQSSSHYSAVAPLALFGNGNPDTPGGIYTWIILENGQVVGTSRGLTALTDEQWFAGFNGTYP